MSQNGPSISPNLLMNYNPYDVLEPQKVAQVDRLIDIGDTPSTHMDPSLLDQKRKYDLVDLFQNLYVTPDLVTNTPATTNVSGNIANDIYDKDFLDKLETRGNVNVTKDAEKVNDDSLHLVKKARVLVPKVSLDDPAAVEDLVDKILAEKNIEKLIREKLKNKVDASTVSDRDTSSNTVMVRPVKVLNVPTDIELKVTSRVAEVEVSTPTRANTDAHVKEHLSGFKLNKLCAEKPSSNTCIKIDGQISNTLYNFPLIAIKKDEKVFRKKRVMKPESVTRDFVRGADYYEKSIVLPQMMARIKKRQADIEERKSQNRRLILDAGVKTKADFNNSKLDEVKRDKKDASGSSDGVKKTAVDDWGKVNPIVLMADCNKERLKALEQGRMFQKFVMNGK